MSTIARRGLCLVIAAPSGAGKSSIARALVASEPGLDLSISVTTRPPRRGEQDGLHYHFRSQTEFDALVAEDKLLEWAYVFGRSYGTPRAPVEQALAQGRDVIFDIDWQGHHQIRAALPEDVVGVFVLPPSLGDLEVRMRARGDVDDREIERRLAAARAEIAHWPEFDHVLVNDTFDDAVASVRAILQAARIATPRQVGLAAFVSALG
ncbi:MAG: guanylate kinase [Acetobacteraceae bacterium]|nr:guanylate kinase [Acetobacteraceae bacterium]